MAFKMRSGHNPAFKNIGSSPFRVVGKKIMHNAPYPSSVYDDRYYENEEDRPLSTKQKRWLHANKEINPSQDYSGEVVGEEGWNQEASGASDTQVVEQDRPWLNKKEKKEYLASLKKRRENPRVFDLKKDRSGNQLTKSMVEKGYSQVQDPYGNYHVLNRQGGVVGSTFGYSPESKAWRRKESLPSSQDPIETPVVKDPNKKVKEIVDEGENVQNAKITTGPTGGSTVTDLDTGEIVQDDAHFDDSGRNLLPKKKKVVKKPIIEKKPSWTSTLSNLVKERGKTTKGSNKYNVIQNKINEALGDKKVHDIV